MKKYFLILTSVFAFVYSALAQSSLPDYGVGSQVIGGTPGTSGSAIASFWNPAAWSAMREFELGLYWNDKNVLRGRMDNWGASVGGHGLGFSVRRNDFLAGNRAQQIRRTSVTDYQIALGGGSPADYWGVSYGWSRGASDLLHRDHYLSVGNISRPWKYLSLGNAAALSLGDGDYRGISDIGVRPFGTHRVTLFGDAAYGKRDNFRSMQWGTGVEVQPFDGLSLAFKLSKPYDSNQDKLYSVSLGFSLNGMGFNVVPHYNKENDLASTSYMVRVGSQQPTFGLNKFIDRDRKLLTLPMKGSLVYQKSRWLDSDKIALRETTELIENAKKDRAVGAIALNLSGFSGSRELVWELREKLMNFQSSGKKVYIYFDRLGMSSYYLASCADYLYMDPQGDLTLPGFLAGKTFWKGFLDKIGIGVSEWRYFDYKSAMEGFTRKEMSDKDKEQRLALISDFYDQWSKDIASSRNISVNTLRAVIDTAVYISPEMALQYHLVDTLARWHNTSDLVEQLSGEKPDPVKKDQISAEEFAYQGWGEIPEIAVVYAVGECDMDTGIKGRYTSRVLKNLAKESKTKAVILRADSPGGDGLPSDLVAEQMKAVSRKKPMFVSQGNLAASGGYWISMNGDKIYSSPFCITGSIGVIGGWFWNEKLTEKTGFTSDYVKIGEHAELGFGITLPLIGLQIPDRNLTDDEQTKVEKMIKSFYVDFTRKVANGRGLEQSYVDSVGQGRVWSGSRAIGLRLVDRIGTLDDVIADAKATANLKKSDYVKIVEYPKPGWINFAAASDPFSPLSILQKFLGKESGHSEDYELSVMRRLSANQSLPLYMVNPEDIPADN